MPALHRWLTPLLALAVGSGSLSACCARAPPQNCPPGSKTVVVSRPASDGQVPVDGGCQASCEILGLQRMSSCAFVTLSDGGPGLSCDLEEDCL